MLNGAKGGTLALNNRTMEYVSFGHGDKTLIMLPGLGDGLRTVKESAVPLSFMYKEFAKKYKVYIFSRVNQLSEGATTEDMARDVRLAMDAVGIQAGSVVGVSQGGMVAQYLAINYPESVEKLVLAVTLSRQNDKAETILYNWLEMAQRGDYKALLIDTAENSYSEAYLRTHRRLFPFLTLTGKPKDFNRFIIQVKACLSHNAYERLRGIKCPTLVIGGACDKIVGAAASQEIAGQIAGSRLFIYNELGHAAYEEAKDFNQRILDFFA